MPSTAEIDEQVLSAKSGNKQALEAIILYTQGHIYNLALRMLQSPADAEDATQEILIKVITHLSAFRGESAFTTWVYRVASNHLLNMRLRSAESRYLNFDGLADMLDESLASAEPGIADDYEEQTLAEEVKRSCTLGMLTCLDRDHRMALILGELFELSSEDAAYIMDITPANFRKRLSRARKMLVNFVSAKCGIVNPTAPCRCNKHITNKIRVGLMNPAQLLYANQHDAVSEEQDLQARKQELSMLCRSASLLRSHPTYTSSQNDVEAIKALLDSTHLDF